VANDLLVASSKDVEIGFLDTVIVVHVDLVGGVGVDHFDLGNFGLLNRQ